MAEPTSSLMSTVTRSHDNIADLCGLFFRERTTEVALAPVLPRREAGRASIGTIVGVFRPVTLAGESTF